MAMRESRVSNAGRRNGKAQRYRIFIPPETLVGILLLPLLAALFGVFLRHGFPGQNPEHWQALLQQPFETLESFISWSVLGHFLFPTVVGVLVAWLVTAGFLRHFYNLPGGRAANRFLIDILIATIPARLRPRIPVPSRRFIIIVSGVLVCIFLMPMTTIAVFGLFVPLEPGPRESFRLIEWSLIGAFVLTWVITVLPVLLLRWILLTVRRPLRLKRETFEKERRGHTLLCVGGPGKISIAESDSVAITERNGRPQDVLGPGTYDLLPYEYVHTILNLSEHEREGDVDVVTKDGIQATVELTVIFCIAPTQASRFTVGSFPVTDQLPVRTPGKPYPYTRAAVRSAAQAGGVDRNQRATSWQDLPFAVTEAGLQNAMARYRLDELFFPEPDLEAHRVDLRQEVLERGQQVLQPLGIELTGIRMSPLRVKDPILKGYLEHWKATWRKRGQVAKAQGQVSAIEERERDFGDVESATLQRIAEVVQHARSQNGLENVRPLAVLRFIGALERVVRQSGRLTDPGSAEVLEQLRALRRRLDEDAVAGRGDSTDQ